MELGVNELIYSGCIYFSKELKKGAVYMLNGYGDDRVVVKIDSEAYSNEDVRFLGGVMAQIDPGVRPIALVQSEMQEMMRWTDETMPTVDLMESAANLKWALTSFGSRKWVKMKAFKLVTLDEASSKMGEGDKTDVRIIAASLNASGGLEKLGGIIAADFFIGNGDRFIFPPPGCKWPVEGGQRLKTIWNVGNVFVAVDNRQGKGRLAGLDVLDPNNSFKNVNQKLAIDEVTPWLGSILGKTKAAERMQFCHDVVEDLNSVLGPRNRKVKFLQQTRLGAQAANRLFSGMQIGMDRIKQSLSRHLKASKPLPVGLGHRAELLGWKL
jgi:hypothetical protein